MHDNVSVKPKVDATDDSKISCDKPRFDSWDGKATPSAVELDLYHVLEAYRASLRKMIPSYERMWDGRLGETDVVKHRI